MPPPAGFSAFSPPEFLVGVGPRTHPAASIQAIGMQGYCPLAAPLQAMLRRNMRHSGVNSCTRLHSRSAQETQITREAATDWETIAEIRAARQLQLAAAVEAAVSRW
ncbi:hypothetical protein KXV85_004016, partial [Aspergillus fumigatus]